jgi:hypothetical protein
MNVDYTINITPINLNITYNFTTANNARITTTGIVYDMNLTTTVHFSEQFKTQLTNLGMAWAGIYAVETKIVNHWRLMTVSLVACTINNTSGALDA